MPSQQQLPLPISIIQLTNPLQTNKALYSKYSSSQTYYYSNVISDIVKQKRTKTNIHYQDAQFLSDSQQYLKRFYMHHEYPGKMFTFKEYYFYHEDCPRIFMKYIEEIYTKWQDRKRDLVYKKLKILYNQSFSSSRSSSSKDQQKRSASGVTHFLLEISDYNPFSKKYYLRVQAKKELQQKQKQKKQKQQIKNKSIRDISSLNHQLSIMLNDIGQLSMISTFQKHQSPRLSTLYHPKKLKINYSSQYSTHHNSQSNSNIQSNVKFNFKKTKNQKDYQTNQKDYQLSTEIIKQKQSINRNIINEQFRKKIQLEQRQKSTQQKYKNIPLRASPKFAQKSITNTNDQFSKSKSIYQLSTINSSNKKSQFLLHLNLNKKQNNLKLKSDKKPSSRQNKVVFQNKSLKKYDSQKKMMVTNIQNKKRLSGFGKSEQKYHNNNELLNNNHNTLSHNKHTYNVSSHVQLKGLSRQSSIIKQPIIKISNNGVQFADNKLQHNNNDQIRFRSHKSQYASLNKQNFLKRQNSPAKAQFKINNQKNNKDNINKQYNNKDKYQLNSNKKGHQLRLQ